MESRLTTRSLFERLFNRSYFKSLRFWYVDVFGCYILASVVTPADPYSAILVTILLLAVWLPVRKVIARRLSKISQTSQNLPLS